MEILHAFLCPTSLFFGKSASPVYQTLSPTKNLHTRRPWLFRQRRRNQVGMQAPVVESRFSLISAPKYWSINSSLPLDASVAKGEVIMALLLLLPSLLAGDDTSITALFNLLTRNRHGVESRVSCNENIHIQPVDIGKGLSFSQTFPWIIKRFPWLFPRVQMYVNLETLELLRLDCVWLRIVPSKTLPVKLRILMKFSLIK